MLDKIITAYMNTFDNVFSYIFHTTPLTNDGGNIMIIILIACAVIYSLCDFILYKINQQNN